MRSAPHQVPAGPLTATLSLAMAVSLFLPYALGTLGPFLTSDLGLSRAALGSLTTALYVVAGCCSPVVGPLVDRFGGRLLLLVLFAVSGGAAAWAAAAPSYPVLLAAVAVSGVAAALGNPVTNQILAVAVPPERQGLLVGVKQSGVQVGAFAAGAALPGLAGAVGWRTALLASASLGAVGMIATVVTVPEMRPGPVRATPVAEPLPAGVAWMAGYALLMGIGVGAVGAYLPLYAVERLGFGAATAGLAASLIGFVGILARVAWGREADRNPSPVPVALGRLASGAVLATALIWAADAAGSWALWAGATAFGATAVAWNAVGMLALVRGMPSAVSGRASGRVLLGFYLGLLASPVAFGWSVDRTGTYTVGWAVVTASFAVAVLLMARWHRHPD